MITGITFGAFDLLHPGHVTFLKDCKLRCDRLFVGLHVDPSLQSPSKNKPAQTVVERWIQLDALRHVDMIIPYETERDLIGMLCHLSVQKRFLGSEYESGTRRIVGEDYCGMLNIEIVMVPRLHHWSSTELRERIKSGA